jgi:hypothetical protein
MSLCVSILPRECARRKWFFESLILATCRAARNLGRRLIAFPGDCLVDLPIALPASSRTLRRRNAHDPRDLPK